MSDATDAVIDIIEAIDEYGSAITLNSITTGVYDTTTGLTADTVVPHVMKALPKDYTSKELDNKDIHINDIKFVLYFDGPIGYDDKIIFNSVTYNLLNIDKKILQDVNIVYTIQGRA